MKTNMLKLKLAGIAMLTVFFIGAGNVYAAIINTPHNLGSTGTGPNTYSGTDEVCVFCHTPHGGDNSASVPLWNKTLTDPALYSTYDTLGTSSMDSASAITGSVSIACLSCHDGTQAMDTVLNQPGSGSVVATYGAGLWTGVSSPAGIANIGLDLSNDHPVGIQYGGGGITATATAAATRDIDFKATSYALINNKPVWWVDTEAPLDVNLGSRQKTDMQLYTRSIATIDGGAAQPFVECASCHDPHTENTTFLRVSNAGSAVCLACHIK